jgi:hypothetical protein
VHFVEAKSRMIVHALPQVAVGIVGRRRPSDRPSS